MKCRKCGKKMERRSKRDHDAYYCRACGAQATKIHKKAIIQETRDIMEYLTASEEEGFNET